jgi:hypothetical protein
MVPRIKLLFPGVRIGRPVFILLIFISITGLISTFPKSVWDCLITLRTRFNKKLRYLTKIVKYNEKKIRKFPRNFFISKKKLKSPLSLHI